MELQTRIQKNESRKKEIDKEISLMRRRRNHLKRMLVRSEKSLIVAPPLNEGEATSFARRVCQCVDYVLLKKKSRI